MTEAAPTQTLEFQEALELVMASILEDEWFMDVYGNMCKSQTSTKTYTKQPWFSGRGFFLWPEVQNQNDKRMGQALPRTGGFVS